VWKPIAAARRDVVDDLRERTAFVDAAALNVSSSRVTSRGRSPVRVSAAAPSRQSNESAITPTRVAAPESDRGNRSTCIAATPWLTTDPARGRRRRAASS
jgi:hypothetical protein